MATTTYYSILGVEASATYEQMLAAYRERTQLLNPPSVARDNSLMTDNMRTAQRNLDEAWGVLSQVSSRQRYDRDVMGITNATYQAPPPIADQNQDEVKDDRRPRRRDECRLCGSSPAIAVDIRVGRSGLLSGALAGSYGERGPLCRDCGLATVRDMTDTLLTGGIDSDVGNGFKVGEIFALLWLMLLGWLVNSVTALGNIWSWKAVHGLGAPVRDPKVASLSDAPMDPGRSLFLRSGFRFIVLIVLGWVAFIILLTAIF